MADAPRDPAGDDAPLPIRRPWVAALLLGSVATPAAVILAVPAPAPIDALFAWPLVVMDRWAGTAPPDRIGPLGRVLAVVVGIVLTWIHYVLLARLLVWQLARRASGP